MKKLIFTLFVIVLILSCKESKEIINNKNETAIKEKANLIINNWHKAASEANYKNYFGAMDSLSVFIGTDASENWNKKEFSAFSKPYFDKGKAWNFTPLKRNIYISKNQKIVWFDELLKTWMGICRGSGVLEKQGEKWKIKHYVLSMTIPNDNVNQVFNINKEKDSLYLTTNFLNSTKN